MEPIISHSIVGQPTRDGFGRALTYLRLSVTDRCDMRCFYCLPRTHRGFETPEHWLTPAETQRAVEAFVGLGVRHVRLTGGEPLVRRELPEIARRLAAVAGLEEVSLSTNASRLDRYAQELRTAGVGRINASLDSLEPECFRRITGSELAPVLAGLDAAAAVGFAPIKINMVVMRGINDHEVEAMAEFCMARGFTLRYIETMPVGSGGREAVDHYLDLEEVRQRLAARYTLEPAAMRGSGPARYVHLAGTGLVVGFITPLSQHFCETCNRVRLSVDGTLYLCLGQEDRVELRPLLRDGADRETLMAVIAEALRHKPLRHDFRDRPGQIIRPMAALGG